MLAGLAVKLLPRADKQAYPAQLDMWVCMCLGARERLHPPFSLLLFMLNTVTDRLAHRAPYTALSPTFPSRADPALRCAFPSSQGWPCLPFAPRLVLHGAVPSLPPKADPALRRH